MKYPVHKVTRWVGQNGNVFDTREAAEDSFRVDALNSYLCEMVGASGMDFVAKQMLADKEKIAEMLGLGVASTSLRGTEEVAE